MTPEIVWLSVFVKDDKFTAPPEVNDRVLPERESVCESVVAGKETVFPPAIVRSFPTSVKVWLSVFKVPEAKALGNVSCRVPPSSNSKIIVLLALIVKVVIC